MKHISEYIFEELIKHNVYIFPKEAGTTLERATATDKVRGFLLRIENNSIKTNKRYSLYNKVDREKLFKEFRDYMGYSYELLKKLNITSALDLAYLLARNEEKMKDANWPLGGIKSFDETEREKEYKKWKASSDYVEGKPFNREEHEDDDEDELVRTLVVYDAKYPGNPDTTKEYEFKGVRSKESMHQVHMIRQDWHHLTGCKYYDARECFLSYYLKKSEEELKQRDQAIDDSDLK